MEKKYIYNIIGVIALLAVAIFSSSCSPDWIEELDPQPGQNGGVHVNQVQPDRTPTEETRNVLLLYSLGFNSLSSYLADDIKDLASGDLPKPGRTENVVLVYSHQPQRYGKYDTPTSPVLFRLSKRDTTVMMDTLVVYEEGTVSASKSQLNNVLTFVKDKFPAKSYGMVFSSHATGYLPAGYYLNPESGSGSELLWKRMRKDGLTAVPYIEEERDESMPMVKSIGQDQVGIPGEYISYEIELNDFADAIPMKLDYILFDACLMGGIEVAYELAGKAGMVGFSQTEVLAEGFCYGTLTQRLFMDEGPDLKGACEDYFNQYDTQNGVYRSATISLIDCDKLEPLAEVCRKLFDKYRENIQSLNYSKVQIFYRSNRHWFYDLESILANAGISMEEMNELEAALDQCVAYKAHTPRFMDSFDIITFSGFSMYLPSHGGRQLDGFYRTLKWNEATGLVN